MLQKKVMYLWRPTLLYVYNSISIYSYIAIDLEYSQSCNANWYSFNWAYEVPWYENSTDSLHTKCIPLQMYLEDTPIQSASLCCCCVSERRQLIIHAITQNLLVKLYPNCKKNAFILHCDPYTCIIIQCFFLVHIILCFGLTFCGNIWVQYGMKKYA